MVGMQKIQRIISQTRLDGNVIGVNVPPIDILKQAEIEKLVHRYKKDIYFCVYKTTFDESDAIMIVFTMKLPGSSIGSSASSEIIMEIVADLERLLTPYDEIQFVRDVEGKKKNIAFIKFIKRYNAAE